MGSAKKPAASAKSKKPSGASKQPPHAWKPGADPLAVAPHAIANVSAGLAGFVTDTAPYDPDEAKALADALRPRLAAIAPDRIVIPRVDVAVTARVLLTVHAFVTGAAGVYDSFSQLAKAGLFDISNVDQLRDVMCVVLYAHREAEAAGAFKTNAKIPPALDEASAQVEREMQSVLEHNFAEHPTHGPVLAQLRPGTSYADRAGDLLGYAQIYEAEHAVVSKDTKYKPTHLADAKKHAGAIYAALGQSMTPQARAWADLLWRAWTLGSAMYFEVRETGLYLHRYDPLREQRFPSVFVVGRPGVGQKKGKKGAGDPGSGSGKGAAQGGEGPVN